MYFLFSTISCIITVSIRTSLTTTVSVRTSTGVSFSPYTQVFTKIEASTPIIAANMYLASSLIFLLLVGAHPQQKIGRLGAVSFLKPRNKLGSGIDVGIPRITT